MCCPSGEYVIRFPTDSDALATLRKEERVVAGLWGRVTLRIPDTRVISLGSGLPSIALHSLVPGSSWFQLGTNRLAGAAAERLAADLALFMAQTHGVPLDEAAEWVGLATRDRRWREGVAERDGRPSWFRGEALARIRGRLAATLPADLAPLVEDTAARYDRVRVSPDDLVFLHGDLHGGNLAFAVDEVGPRLIGVFDFEAAGILDYHYDFGRLNLVYDELPDQVIREYARLAPARPIDRERVETCARAFVLYLLAEHVGDDGRVPPDLAAGYVHLVRLLRAHLAYDASRVGA
jgi:aminoglycoside phosphotransferase (APT) family kinase protein